MAGRTYKQIAISLVDLLQGFKQLDRTIPADTRSHLERIHAVHVSGESVLTASDNGIY